MNEKEVKEVVRLLEEAGWQPMVCDTAVPYFDCGVPAGIPQMVGDYEGDCIMLPKGLTTYEPIVVIKVRGESMCGAGIENGDMVTLQLDSNVEDGDVVVAWLDGEATLKVFYRDEEGEVWLVPQNEKYQPIRLRDFTNVWILGRVIDVKKAVPRVSYRQIQQQMKGVKREQGNVPNEDKLKRAVAKVAKQMEGNSRLWFSIYRVLADMKYIEEGDFEGLRNKMDDLFPDNDFSINPKDLSRLNVDVFRRRLFLWDEESAPVQGKRFWDYYNLARKFQELLI